MVTFKKLVKNKISISILFFLIFFSTVLAEDNTTVGSVGGFNFKWFEIGPPIDLKNFGVLNFLGYLAAFLIFWMAIYTMWLVIKVSWLYLKSRGDTGLVEQATETGRELFKGILIAFLWMGIYALFSVFLGVGNMFRWGEALTQCGDGTPYFQAEYNARQVLKENGLSFVDDNNTKLYSFCCDRRPTLNLVGYTIPVSFDKTIYDESDPDIIYAAFTKVYDLVFLTINQDKNGGGWYFINTTNLNLPVDQVEEQCRVIFD